LIFAPAVTTCGKKAFFGLQVLGYFLCLLGGVFARSRYKTTGPAPENSTCEVSGMPAGNHENKQNS
jgi:hypothetical protein